jgi:Glycosyltransferase family 87
MRPRLWLWLSLLVAGTSWSYVHRILGPWTNNIRLKKGVVLVQVSDLYSPWVGTRELLLHRRNPYGPDVSREIQTVYYGHAINQTYTKPGVEIVDEQRFAYPVYETLLTAPLAYADFKNVQRWAPFVLGSLAGLSILFCLGILRWRPPREAAAAMILLILSSPQIVQGLRLQQLAIVESCLLAFAAWCAARNHLAGAGALLAFFTIKPQVALLPLCWFAIWVAGDWRRRWHLAASFAATLAALIAAGELLLPGWIGYFLAGLAAYRRYALPTSLLRIALGDLAGEILGGLVVIAILAYGWSNRKAMGDSRQFISVLAVFLIGTILSFPLFTPFNQVLLILPAILLLHDWKTLPKFSRLVFIAAVSWPWMISLGLLLFPPRLDSPSQMPLLPSFVVPFIPLLLPLLLATRRSKTSKSRASRGIVPPTNLSAIIG